MYDFWHQFDFYVSTLSKSPPWVIHKKINGINMLITTAPFDLAYGDGGGLTFCNVYHQPPLTPLLPPPKKKKKKNVF